MLIHWHHSNTIMYEQTHKKHPIEKHVDVKLTLSCLKYKSYMNFNKLLYIRKCNRFQDNNKFCAAVQLFPSIISFLYVWIEITSRKIFSCVKRWYIHVKNNDKFPMRQNHKILCNSPALPRYYILPLRFNGTYFEKSILCGLQ